MAETAGLKALIAELQEVLGEEITEDEAKVLAFTMSFPTVNARVDRKINMGNYESLGIGLSVNRPIFIPKSLEATFDRMEAEGLRQSYNQAAQEMNKRVDRLKARAKGEDD
jgi:hypothetical protein